MLTICKSFTFDAAHRLDRLPATHKCHRVHGHTYRVEVEIACRRLDENIGMAVDYDELDRRLAPFHAEVDHRYLNDIPGLEVPTTEVLARWLLDRLFPIVLVETALAHAELVAVRVYESMTTWAEARL